MRNTTFVVFGSWAPRKQQTASVPVGFSLFFLQSGILKQLPPWNYDIRVIDFSYVQGYLSQKTVIVLSRQNGTQSNLPFRGRIVCAFFRLLS